MKRFNYGFLIVIGILLLFFTIYVVISNQKYTALEKQNQKLKQKVISIENSPSGMSLDDFYLHAQKTKAIKEIFPSDVFFQATSNYIGQNSYQVDIYLKGEPNMQFDAADLVLITDNLQVKKITPGSTFPKYPRKVNKNEQIAVTGTASLNSNVLTLGKPNKLFVSLTIEKKDPEKKGELIMNAVETKVYLMGNYVLDDQKSFGKIKL